MVTPRKRTARAVVNRGLRGKILAHLDKNIGNLVHLNTLREVTEAEAEPIQKAMNELIAKPELEGAIEVVARGQVWRYRPTAAKAGKRVFEELAITKAGDIIIQDEAGTVYRAVEL